MTVYICKTFYTNTFHSLFLNIILSYELIRRNQFFNLLGNAHVSKLNPFKVQQVLKKNLPFSVHRCLKSPKQCNSTSGLQITQLPAPSFSSVLTKDWSRSSWLYSIAAWLVPTLGGPGFKTASSPPEKFSASYSVLRLALPNACLKQKLRPLVHFSQPLCGLRYRVGRYFFQKDKVACSLIMLDQLYIMLIFNFT